MGNNEWNKIDAKFKQVSARGNRILGIDSNNQLQEIILEKWFD